MTGLLQALIDVKPRETAGARTSSRYDFQAHFAILKLIELHKSGNDYRMIFDYYDDLAVADHSTEPTRLCLYQIKSKADGNWTIKAFAKINKTGSPPCSIPGKMYHNIEELGDFVHCITFVSNANFAFKLADGKKANPDYFLIAYSDLHEEERKIVENAIDADFPPPRKHDISARLFFERTTLSVADQEKYVLGNLLDFIECDRSKGVLIKPLYKVLITNIRLKSGVSQAISSVEELFEKKTLCRGELEKLFHYASMEKFHFDQFWPVVDRELLRSGRNSLEILAIQTACYKHRLDRVSGDPRAIRLSDSIYTLIVENVPYVNQSGTLMDVVESIKNRLGRQDGFFEEDEIYGAIIVRTLEVISESGKFDRLAPSAEKLEG